MAFEFRRSDRYVWTTNGQQQVSPVQMLFMARDSSQEVPVRAINASASGVLAKHAAVASTSGRLDVIAEPDVRESLTVDGCDKGCSHDPDRGTVFHISKRDHNAFSRILREFAVRGWMDLDRHQCPHCNMELRPNYSHSQCIGCNHSIPCPNVRDASYVRGLTVQARLYQAGKSKRIDTDSVGAFEDHIRRHGKAVLARSATLIASMMLDKRQTATRYSDAVAHSGIADDPPYGLWRAWFPPVLFPYYEDQIHYAVLALDGHGLADFGDCHVSLKEKHIGERSTVFYGNSLHWAQKQNARGVPNPKLWRRSWSRRAPWRLRAEHAAAHFGCRIPSSAQVEDFAKLMTQPTGDRFVEVHIFGSLHAGSFEEVAPPIEHRVSDEIHALAARLPPEDA